MDVARQPGQVRRAVAALRDAGRYCFVSTGNVYVDTATLHLDESAPLLPALEADEMPDTASDGRAEVACEQAVLAVFGDRALIAEPD